MARRDFSHPFRLGGARQAAQAAYAAHVEQMVRQVLLTAPGERINLPEFGCGLRRLVFEPHSVQLDATTNVLVRSALERWLGDHIAVRDVRVFDSAAATAEQVLEVVVDYELLDTRQAGSAKVRVLP